ncbi:hypothetical protein [Saccharopolyspora pogona]|uniref:hypothetical protein n=1 Tax=Saccharopolyspora pogona TaxID=333966 RepID=UPI001CC26467|nr:hypothetical protein [Saccharopolyspora pogona]
MFWPIDTKNPALVVLAITLGVACLSVPYAVAGSLLTELFPPQLRYSGVSIAFNLGGVVSGFWPETQLVGRKRGWAGARSVGSVRESVTSREEVRPMNAVSVWVLPSRSRPGD